MLVDPTIPLSSLSPNDTFMIGDVGWAVADAQALPTPAPGQVWVINLNVSGVSQNPGTLAVIPVPLKVVHA